jgi:hypothetical protein
VRNDRIGKILGAFRKLLERWMAIERERERESDGIGEGK